MSNRLALAILISGNGSNLQSIIDAIEAGRLNAEVKAVISNNPEAFGLTRAARHKIPSFVFNHSDYAHRDQFDAELQSCLQALNPDFIVLAGFMRILGPAFIRAFEHKILNIHPSLLPAYKGLNTHQRVLDNNETQHGVSIHLVTAELDDGPILIQGSYPIETGDRVEDLQHKGHQLEHQMYPDVLGRLSENNLTIKGGQVLHEQTLLEKPLVYSS